MKRLAFLFFAMVACQKPESAPFVLRSYDVPLNKAAQVRSAVASVFYDGTKSVYGSAQLAPDGHLLVLATADMQKGVKDLLDALAKKQPTPQATITVDYWLVTGAPGKSGAGDGLNELAPALAEIEKNDGPQNFSLLEHLRLSSLSGEEASVKGRVALISRHVARGDKDHVSIDMRLEDWGSLATHVEMKPGQIMVLGASGNAGKEAPAGSALYYLVRATVHEPR